MMERALSQFHLLTADEAEALRVVAQAIEVRVLMNKVPP